MNEELVLEWIELVWEPATEWHRALLVLDSFNAHLTPAVKRKLKEINTIPVFIQGGCTSKVQPLDVCLNKPFKSYIRQYWSKYVISESGSLALHQKVKPPTKPRVASWVSARLQQLQEKADMITHSFEACGITSSRPTDVRPPGLLDGQVCSDSEDEHENPFIDEEEDGVMLEL